MNVRELYNSVRESPIDDQYLRVMTHDGGAVRQLETVLDSFPSRQLEIALNSLPSYQLEMANDNVTTALSESPINILLDGQIDLVPSDFPGYQVEIPFDALSNGQFGAPEAGLDGYAANLVATTLSEFRVKQTFAHLQVGKSHFLNDLGTKLKAYSSRLESQLQAKFELGQSMFFGPLFQELPPEPEFYGGLWCFSTCGPTAELVASYVPIDAPVNAHILRFFSRALDNARAALNLVNKVRNAILHALQEGYQSVCIVVARRAAFAVHGFHPPAPWEAFTTDTLSWRGCGVSKA